MKGRARFEPQSARDSRSLRFLGVQQPRSKIAGTFVANSQRARTPQLRVALSEPDLDGNLQKDRRLDCRRLQQHIASAIT